MSVLMTLRRAVARRLRPGVKAILRRVTPRWILLAAPTTRRFWLTMPTPPGGLGPMVRDVAVPARVRFTAPYRSFVPRLLDERGVARYEPETMAAFLAAISLLEATDAFDVGANVGIFSIVGAALTTTRLVGFEPTPDVAATFRSVVEANGIACEVEAIALGATTGSATLYLSNKSESSNSLKAGFRTASGTVDVPVERLDDVVTRLGRRPTVLKIDTETTEPDVLVGAPDLLTRTRPWIVCEVLVDRTEVALKNVLEPYRYHFHHLGPTEPIVETDRIVGDRTYDHRDWLFTPDPLPADFARHYHAWIEAIRATR
ncbi:MAG: FkbM family methyltransferase [Chloroflexota bacterium]|nr:MAG: FkbM family methyltransferase [Chloroflexota bacterium]